MSFAYRVSASLSPSANAPTGHRSSPASLKTVRRTVFSEAGPAGPGIRSVTSGSEVRRLKRTEGPEAGASHHPGGLFAEGGLHPVTRDEVSRSVAYPVRGRYDKSSQRLPLKNLLTRQGTGTTGEPHPSAHYVRIHLPQSGKAYGVFRVREANRSFTYYRHAVVRRTVKGGRQPVLPSPFGACHGVPAASGRGVP